MHISDSNTIMLRDSASTLRSFSHEMGHLIGLPHLFDSDSHNNIMHHPNTGGTDLDDDYINKLSTFVSY
jgi:predicted Zn-dependent protease